MLPWDASVSDTLDRAAWLDTHLTNVRLPATAGYDLAQKNLTMSYAGLDPTGAGDYMNLLTDTTSSFASWLFDRPSTIYVAYFRGGLFKLLREAVRNADWYHNNLYKTGPAAGAFYPKNPNPTGYIGGNGAMYSYLECLEYQHWITGDDSVLSIIPTMITFYDRENEPTHWTPTGAWGQERHTCFEFLANICAYELTGLAQYKTNSLRIMGDYIRHQNGEHGQIDSILRAQGRDPAQKIDGALYHFGWQHAADWADADLGASPWMSALSIDAALHLYHMEESDSLKSFFKRFGSFLARIMYVYVDVAHGGVTWFYDPYVVLWDGSETVDMDPWGDPSHSPEIGASIAWGNYFADILDQHDDQLDRRADSFYQGTLNQLASFGIRPGATPEYYVNNPPRMLAWEMRPSGSWTWLSAQSGPVAVEQIAGPVEAGLSLANAPNPFNPETRFVFNVPAAGRVKLEIFRLDGSLAAKLTDGQMKAGRYNASWRATGEPSGMYWARVTSNGKAAAKKVLLMK
jgi:hypothetical protein